MFTVKLYTGAVYIDLHSQNVTLETKERWSYSQANQYVKSEIRIHRELLRENEGR